MTNLNQIDACLVTDKGQIRDLNEDFFASYEPTTPQEESQNGWLYLIADGVGGADAGEVASQFASEQVIHHFLANKNESDWGKRLYTAMQVANTNLRAMAAQQPANPRGMATTMVVLALHDHQAYIGNVGDSRGYLCRQEKLEQITTDHSLVAKLVEEGAITPSEAIHHQYKNVILSSLGAERDPQIDLFPIPLQEGDIVVLCSDGLIRHILDNEIAQLLHQEANATSAAQKLLRLAYDRGGEDNITVGVIRFHPPDFRPLPPAPKESKTPTLLSRPTSVNRAILWTYTFFLCFAQSLLIFLVWLFLRIY